MDCLFCPCDLLCVVNALYTPASDSRFVVTTVLSLRVIRDQYMQA